MHRISIPLTILAAAALFSTAASAQQAGLVLNRISGAYRSMQSYRDSATWTLKAGDKPITARITLAAQRPNKYALEVKGDKLNTVVVSDGVSLVAARPDRKAYTKVRAPLMLMRADVLDKVDVPSLGAQIITLALEGRLRDQGDPLAQKIAKAEITGPQAFGSQMAYTIAFPYDDEHDARVYVTDGDFLIRRAVLTRDGNPETIEDHTQIETDKPISAETFARAVPEGYRLVSTLPALEPMQVQVAGPIAAEFTVQTVDGREVTLSKLKGKVVLLNFFFVT